MNTFEKPLAIIARILLAAIFIFAGLSKIGGFEEQLDILLQRGSHSLG